MARIAFFFLPLIFLSGSVFGQADQQILLMTGNVVKGSVTGQDSLYVYYDQYRKNGNKKAKKLDLERVFSFQGSGGEETLIYAMDTAIGNYFSVEEMRLYIQGEQDAMKYYRGNWVIALGVPLTGGLSYVLTPSVFTFAVPFVYLVGTGLPKYKIPRDRISSPELITEPAYVLGFERVARNKRLFKSLAAGLIGTGLGFVQKEFEIVK